MPDGGRTAAEREAARRERENRRARREGRPAPYEAVAEEFAADPPVFDAPPPAAPEPAAAPEPPVTEAHDVEPPPPSAVEPPPVAAVEPPPVAAVEPPPAAAVEPPDTADAASDPEPLVAPRDPTPRPIRSFPSPPDPEFYADDDDLQTPSGTRRVSRSGRPIVVAGRGGSGRGGAGRRPPAPPRRRSGGSGPARGPRRWWARIAALIVLALVAAVVVFAIEVYQPFGSSAHGAVTVRIPPRTGSDEVARILARDGVVSSSFFFELRAALDGDRGRIRSGTYHLHRGMGYGAVLSALTRAPKAAPTAELTIAEGHTRQYVAALLRRQHVRGSYLADTVRSPLLNPRRYGAPKSVRTLEGFLFPDTFTLVKPVRAQALVSDQLKDFTRRFAGVSLAAAHRLHQSGFAVVTIASLIEAESASPRDDRLVASVIDNRLRDHMMLQLDSTARYATGNFTHALTESELHSTSPYNTHTHFGLPPGPIDSPGLTALQAAAHPASSHYLYFFSKPCSSQTVFASSFGEFEILLQRDYRAHCPKK